MDGAQLDRKRLDLRQQLAQPMAKALQIGWQLGPLQWRARTIAAAQRGGQGDV
jgi:hypothetical protein